MKRSFVIGIIFSLIIVNTVLASEYSYCIRGCIVNTQDNIDLCISEFNICQYNAKTHLNDCSFYFGKNKTTCIKEARGELTNCNLDKKTCLKDIDNNINRCKKKCSYIGKDITCENKGYNAGDVFLKNCDRCECNANGKISCKTTEYCNFNSFDISKESCENNNGLFQKLCAGSIMSTKCTQETYCQCGGKLNLSCGNDSICLYDFYLNKNRKGQFAQEWIRLAEYKKLGNVGICVKKPQLISCGNGICENICNNENCSLAETSYNCKEDCR
jgi:hypothetical protein